MSKKYFGTDGVRGYVGREPMTPDFLVRLGYAVGKALAVTAPREVLIGKDTRRSGYMVESALEAGLSAAGVDVLLSGPLPTPAVSYLTQALRLSAGIVISASHNPYHDNGVKFFAADGAKLAGATEQEIERMLADRADIQFDGEPGRARRLPAAIGRYIEFCKRAFPTSLNLRGLRVVVDCANGAAYRAAPAVFHELGADVVAIGDKPNGVNINVDCGALAPAAAAAKTKKENAAVGVVLDGDADRILLVDENGTVWNGDALLYLIVQNAIARGEDVAGVVGTTLTNLAVERRLRELGVAFFRADVGDRHVNAALKQRNWRVGGEASGHIILRDFHDTGDGIIAALQALRVMQESGKPLSALFKDLRLLPQESRNITVADHRRVLQQPQVVAAIAAARAKLGDDMRLVVRPSGTEALVRLMVEGENTALMRAAMDDIEAALATD